MQADRNPISRLLIFLALLPLNLSLQATPDLPHLVLAFPYTQHSFENSSWLEETKAEADTNETVTVISTSDYYGNMHLLPVSQIGPEPLNGRPDLDWVLWVMIAGTGVIAMAHLLFPNRTRQFFRATLGGRHFSQMEREGRFFDETPFWLLFVNFLLMLSLLIYLTIQQVGAGQIPVSIAEWMIFLVVLGLLIIYYPLKRMVTSFIAWVFHTQTTNEAYTKNLFLFNNLAGILILPFVLYLAYTPSLTGLYVVWGMLALLNLGKALQGAAIGFQQPGFSVYYLILYLCAVELAPMLILAKAVTNVLSSL